MVPIGVVRRVHGQRILPPPDFGQILEPEEVRRRQIQHAVGREQSDQLPKEQTTGLTDKCSRTSVKTMRSYGAVAFNGLEVARVQIEANAMVGIGVLRPARPVRRDQLDSREKGLVPGEVLRVADIQHARALRRPLEK